MKLGIPSLTFNDLTSLNRSKPGTNTSKSETAPSYSITHWVPDVCRHTFATYQRRPLPQPAWTAVRNGAPRPHPAAHPLYEPRTTAWSRQVLEIGKLQLARKRKKHESSSILAGRKHVQKPKTAQRLKNRIKMSEIICWFFNRLEKMRKKIQFSLIFYLPRGEQTCIMPSHTANAELQKVAR